jgi:hypothetical protein
MKVLELQVRVALADDGDETEILEQVRYLVAELSGDEPIVPPRRSQAIATVVSMRSVGPDPADVSGWNECACDALTKGDPLDLLRDLRGLAERRTPRSAGQSAVPSSPDVSGNPAEPL